MISKICAYCGEPFETEKGAAKYCSKDCQQRARADRLMAQWLVNTPKVEYVRICPICGKEFTTTNVQQVYCGKSCSEEATKRRSREAAKRQRERAKKEKKAAAPRKKKAASKKKTENKKAYSGNSSFARPSSPIMDKFKKEHVCFTSQEGDSYASHQQRQVAESIEKYARVKV